MDTQTKYTPGPWNVDIDHQTHITEDITICSGSITSGMDWEHIATANKRQDDPKETLANAKLIAAAPELLEALKVFAHPDLSKLIGGNANGDESIVFQRNSAVMKIGDFKKAAEAIRKATE